MGVAVRALRACVGLGALVPLESTIKSDGTGTWNVTSGDVPYKRIGRAYASRSSSQKGSPFHSASRTETNGTEAQGSSVTGGSRAEARHARQEGRASASQGQEGGAGEKGAASQEAASSQEAARRQEGAGGKEGTRKEGGDRW